MRVPLPPPLRLRADHASFANEVVKHAHELIEEKKYQEAISSLDAEILQNPKSAEAFTERARAYEHLGEYQKAINDANAAISIDPKVAMSFCARGAAYARLGQRRKGLTTSPPPLISIQNARLISSRGSLYLRSNNSEKPLMISLRL